MVSWGPSCLAGRELRTWLLWGPVAAIPGNAANRQTTEVIANVEQSAYRTTFDRAMRKRLKHARMNFDVALRRSAFLPHFDAFIGVELGLNEARTASFIDEEAEGSAEAAASY